MSETLSGVKLVVSGVLAPFPMPRQHQGLLTILKRLEDRTHPDMCDKQVTFSQPPAVLCHWNYPRERRMLRLVLRVSNLDEHLFGRVLLRPLVDRANEALERQH